MSINLFNPERTGSENAAVLPPGETILQNRGHIVLAFKNPSHPNDYWKKSYEGRCMLTNRRVIFLAKDKKSNLRDFVMPFSVIKNWELKQPIFGQNYISSTIKAAPGGGFEGQVNISLTFNHGGACEFGQLVLRTASTAQQHQQYPAPPPSYPNQVPVAGQMNPMTGFYEFPGQQPPQPQPDAPPAYDSLQCVSPSMQHSQGYGVTDRIQEKNQ